MNADVYHAGGLVGRSAEGGDFGISRSFSTVAVTGIGLGGDLGGLAAVHGNTNVNTGYIRQSFATGRVFGTGTSSWYLSVGGLVGANFGQITQSYSASEVRHSGEYGTAGGVVARNYAAISQVYASGPVSLDCECGAQIGALVGSQLFNGTIIKSYWDKNTTGQVHSSGSPDTRGITTADFKAALPSGFNRTVWDIMPGISYPFLRGHGWLNFPIGGYTAYSAPMISVMDHSGTPLDLDPATRTPHFYLKTDEDVLAFNGERGRLEYGANCPPPGYMNENHEPFYINGNYVGDSCGKKTKDPRFLNYRGHSGYDYDFNRRNIYAPAKGALFKAATDSKNDVRKCTLKGWEAWHSFYIDHGNGYTTWYLHADLKQSIDAAIGSDYIKSVNVEAGEEIAVSGEFAAVECYPRGVPPHLHFEVRKGLNQVVDPYSDAFWIAR